MRVTKTRLMRDKTINPNPPICRSKEPSLTVINIYSCSTSQLLNHIEHYNWNLTQAQAAADGGPGTYSEGYFYEAAFKKYTDLSQNHCVGFNYISVLGTGGTDGHAVITINVYDETINRGSHSTQEQDMPMSAPYDQWTLDLLEINYYEDFTLDGFAQINADMPTGPQIFYFFSPTATGEGRIPVRDPIYITIPAPPWT